MLCDIADDDSRTPKDALDELHSDDLLGFPNELAKYSRHRIGHPTSERGIDNRRSRVRCDEAGWVKLLELTSHRRIKGYTGTVEIRNVRGLALVCVELMHKEIRESGTSRFVRWCNLWPIAQHTISHRFFSKMLRRTSGPSTVNCEIHRWMLFFH